MFFMLFFWILLIMCLFYLLKAFVPSLSNENIERNRNATAYDILRERYAKGEISKAEFELRMKDIKV